jgi:predicted ATPase
LWGEIFNMVLARRRGDLPRHISPGVSLQADTLVTFDAEMLDEVAIDRARTGVAGWANPEMLRVTALRLLKSTRADRVAAASAVLDQAMAQADQQSALAWQLRIATTMGEMHRAEGRSDMLRQVLEPVFERLTEGFDTADALRARGLLEGRL